MKSAIATTIFLCITQNAFAESFEQLVKEGDVFFADKEFAQYRKDAAHKWAKEMINNNIEDYKAMTEAQRTKTAEYLWVYKLISDVRAEQGLSKPTFQPPVNNADLAANRASGISANDASAIAAIGGVALAAGALYYGGKAIMGALANSGGSSSSSSSSSSYSPSLYDYSCKVYCLEPSGTTKFVIKAEDSSNAAKLVSAQSRQVCQNAGYGRDHPSSMSSSQCQLK
jgi:hypothetical protein